MITVEYRGVEKDIDSWGITGPKRTALNQGHDRLAFNVTAPFDGDDPFAYGEKIILRIGREGTGTIWWDGKIDFIGYRVDSFRNGDPVLEGFDYKFEGLWGFFIDRHPFQQAYQSWNNDTHQNETYYRSQIILGQAPNGNRQGLRDQIIEIANWVINQTTTEYGAPQFQLDNNYPDGWIPYDGINNIGCGEALKRCLRWIGGGANSLWFDYSANPPKLMCTPRTALDAVTFSVIGAEKINITRRDDLVPAAVALKYRVSLTDGASRYVKIFDDIASPTGYTDVNGAPQPPGVTMAQLRADGLKFGAVVQTFDFEGPKFSQFTGKLSTVAYNPTSAAFWKTFCPELAQVDPATLAIVPDANGNIYTVDGGLPAPVLTYAVVDGNVATWMQANAQAQRFTLYARFSGTLKTDDNRTAQIWNACPKQIQVTLTNVPGGDYVYNPLQSLGEEIPFGLAKQIYDAEAPPQYQGTFTFVDDDYTGSVGIGNVLNLTDGRDEWLTMRAQIQSVTIDYTAGRTSLTLGPATHLGAGDLIDRLRAERGPRSVYLIGFNRQNTANDGVIDIGRPAGANATTGQPVASYMGVYETMNTGAPGNTNLLGQAFLDAANRKIVLQAVPYASEVSPGDGSIIAQLSDIANPPASVGGSPTTNPEQRKRAIRLREIIVPDATGKIYYGMALCSEPYSHSSNDGSLGGSGIYAVISTINNDYLVCTRRDGSSVNIAKMWTTRKSLTNRTVEGVAYTFTQAPAPLGVQNNRTSSDGANSENEVIIEQYQVGEVVYAIRVDYTGVASAPDYIEFGPAREWARRDPQ